MPKQERIFNISRNNKGLTCPYKPILCQEGHCRECQIYLDWQKLGRSGSFARLVGKSAVWRLVLGPVVSHGICLEYQQSMSITERPGGLPKITKTARQDHFSCRWGVVIKKGEKMTRRIYKAYLNKPNLSQI